MNRCAWRGPNDGMTGAPRRWLDRVPNNTFRARTAAQAATERQSPQKHEAFRRSPRPREDSQLLERGDGVSIADADLAITLRRLVANGHPLPALIADVAASVWSRPSVQSSWPEPKAGSSAGQEVRPAQASPQGERHEVVARPHTCFIDPRAHQRQPRKSLTVGDVRELGQELVGHDQARVPRG